MMDDAGATSNTQSDDPLLRAAAAAAAGSPLDSPVESFPLPHLRIGKYQIKREIGSGGMGAVYEAVQDQPRRSVALKLMRNGFSSRSTRARFERESQLLARLRHPGIAQVYEAGTHRQGEDDVPYFVMEYIPGARPITEYADAKKLGIRERIALFLQACDAIQHANDRGIIHRDLKPQNVLVDGSGKVRVIDFGVARASDADALPATLQTETNRLVGTLQYMSPEQLDNDPQDLDARSDVYSLGIVLFETLCGQPPYEVRRAKLSDATRIILESPPISPASIRPELAGDVETVLLKAIHKDRSRRYRSAGELADELRRVLAEEPIEARRDSGTYLIRKRVHTFTVRHRFGYILIMMVVALGAALGIGRAANTWLAADRAFERWSIAYIPRWPDHALGLVRIILVDDDIDLGALARSENLPGLKADDVRSRRSLHGRFMEKLVPSGARVVVWDIGFRKESDYDSDFVKGVESLRAANCDVIIGAGPWRFDEAGLPEISPTIAAAVKWGCTTIEASAREPTTIHLAVRRGTAQPLPSLSLMGAAAFWNPGAAAYVALDAGSQFVQIHPLKFDPVRKAYVRAAPSNTGLIHLTDVATMNVDDPNRGLQELDTVARFAVAVPPDAVLRESTIRYADVLTATPDQLRSWFEGRVIIIGDPKRDVEFNSVDGRRLPGVVAHALALDSLLGGNFIQRPRLVKLLGGYIYGRFILDAIGVLVGAGIGAAFARSPWRRYALLCLGCACLVIGCALAYWQAGALYNPLVAIVGMILACELTAYSCPTALPGRT